MKTIRIKRMVFSVLIVAVVLIQLLLGTWRVGTPGYIGPKFQIYTPFLADSYGISFISQRLGFAISSVPILFSGLILLAFVLLGFLPIRKKRGFAPSALVLLIPSVLLIFTLIGYATYALPNIKWLFQMEVRVIFATLSSMFTACFTVFAIVIFVLTIFSAGKNVMSGFCHGVLGLGIFSEIVSIILTLWSIKFISSDLRGSAIFYIVDGVLTILLIIFVMEQVRLYNKATRIAAKAEAAPAVPSFGSNAQNVVNDPMFEVHAPGTPIENPLQTETVQVPVYDEMISPEDRDEAAIPEGQTQKFCTNCGAPLASSSPFCTNCGIQHSLS